MPTDPRIQYLLGRKKQPFTRPIIGDPCPVSSIPHPTLATRWAMPTGCRSEARAVQEFKSSRVQDGARLTGHATAHVDTWHGVVNTLMVWKMNNWPIAEQTAIIVICQQISGDETMKLTT